MLTRIMNWNPLASTLLGALITYSAILLTQAIELWKRDRAQKKLIHALLQALREEVESLLEMVRMNAPSIEATPDGEPYVQPTWRRHQPHRRLERHRTVPL